MILAAVCGVGVGLGLLGLFLAVRPPREDLAAAVGRWESQRAVRADTGSDTPEWRDQLGARIAAELRGRGITFGSQQRDLTLVGRSLASHLGGKVVLAAFGLVLPSLTVAILWAAGLSVPVVLPATFGVILAAIFFVVPDLALTVEATAKRDELRRALSCYLDLVAMSLAGGRGIAEALPTAAAVGSGWGFDQIDDTITRARWSGTSVWDAFTDLGVRAGVPELKDLGGALSLVAEDGAKVRDSLTARAATQRRKQLAEATGKAEKSDQAIQMAQTVLAIGFLAFLSYPAVVNVLNI